MIEIHYSTMVILISILWILVRAVVCCKNKQFIEMQVRVRGSLQGKTSHQKKAKSINLTLVYMDTFFMAKKALQTPVTC